MDNTGMNQIDTSETPKEINRVATGTDTPQLTLKEFNEINYDALHTLGVHYFAEILKENGRLKKPIYLFALIKTSTTITTRGLHENDIFTLVRANNLEEAIDKIIHNSYIFLKIFLHTFQNCLDWTGRKNNSRKETNDYLQQLANLNIITEFKNIYGFMFWDINKNNEDFDQNYKKFVEQNYETLCKYFIENGDCQHHIGIHKIDKIL